MDTAGYTSTVLMQNDQLADGYLGQQNLQQEFVKKGYSGRPIVYWTVTYNEPNGRNHWTTKIDPDTGQIVTWQRTDAAPAQNLEEAARKQLAMQALTALGVQVPDLTVATETSSLKSKRSGDLPALPKDDPNFRTYLYEYKVPASEWQLGDLTLSYEVRITGDLVRQVSYTYQTPVSFQTWHDRQEKIGMILTGLSLFFTFVLFVLAFVFLFLNKQKKPWWSALWMSLLVTGLFALSNLNEWPTLRQQFVEAGSTGAAQTIGFVVVLVVVAILAVLVGGASYVLIATGGGLVKEVNPKLWTPWRSPEWGVCLRRAMWRGWALCFIWLTLQNAFYWVAQHVFGVWFENDFSMSPSNMTFPLLMPLMAWMAGLQEETTYRLFGVTFFKRYWKSSFLACLLPAMVWALGHSLYPIYPVYTRFIELTLFGLLIGYCYLTWGFETVLFAHVAFDAVQMALPFLFGGNGKEIAIGVLYLVSPIVIGWGLSLVKSRKRLPGTESPPL
ncbi:CPBP family intramembrane glutamic endopeptidase [Tumebacillus flagellatus]|uniref:Abortive phage infection protein n=1 Tax=Tumebacillus flagellatus TaxID=1157490 RepID=A0A074MDX2_9BACL|nr:CPBP family intramembrane glutamic endopeptidase [Tumebacillus flagellatus]KEO84032.1 hypothetical protein EL26_06080 [Tumebacillus flagellatus]